MRVGVFCPTFNVYGGAEVVAAVMANALAQNGHDVTLFTNEEVNQREIKKFIGKSLDSSIESLVNPSLIQPRGLLDFYQTILRSYIVNLKCDLWIDVYSNCVFPWTKISYVHFPFLNHYSYRRTFPYLRSRNLLHVGGMPYAFFEKNFADYDRKLVVANSKYTADEIREFSGKKVRVLYPPMPSIISRASENPTKNHRKDLVVTVSRFKPDKELEKIPYIASLTDPTVQFAIIGRVHDQGTLLSLQEITRKLGLESRVQFLPDASRLKMTQMLKNAKIYLHTMIGEHFGISIVEAMTMGCIPIVHDSGGAREFVPRDFRYSSIFEAAAKVTKEIHEWSPQKAVEVAKIADNFSEERFSRRFIELFNQYTQDFV